MYLCSIEYTPALDHDLHPLDPELGIDWPTVGRDGSPLTFQLSEKDSAAPSLQQALDAGVLPTFPT
jgi:dTDP-4-dehydrorhamnose 3,5-epimerase